MFVILVDYDNILNQQRMKGLDFVVDKIVRSIGPEKLPATQRILVRLYGGWYEGNKATKRAQELESQIIGEFPKPIVLFFDKVERTFIVKVELAYALAVNPREHLFHTFRPNGVPPKLKVITPKNIGCNHKDCPLIVLRQLFDKRRCPRKGCYKKLEDVLTVARQKLVDTMLTSDLLHYVGAKHSVICVVTSDDDLLPGIMSGFFNGVSIIHVHTHPDRRTYEFYCRGTDKNYIQINL